MEKDRYLTVGQFVSLLEKNIYEVGVGTVHVDYDILQQPGELIKRRTVAGIIHQVLLCRGEADEEHVEAALVLKDLYNCRTCVNHIAQVYTKGIMEEWDNGLFGVDENLTCNEAKELMRRVLDRQHRRKPGLSVSVEWTTLMWREAEVLLKADRRILLVDVRSKEAYRQGHRRGSINVPLSELFKNPYCVCADRSTVLFLYCQKGYMSRIAAGLLVKAGYQRVYVVV